MSSRRPRARAAARMAALAAAAGLLAACSGGGSDEPAGAEASSPATPTPAAAAPPAPERGACYRLKFEAALAPTNEAARRPCAKPHTAQTYATGTLDTVVDGHLLAVDSAQVTEQVARDCPARLPEFVGGDLAALRLSMIRPVWFTPTVEESDQGADWYRCDAVVVSGERLVSRSGSLEGVLDAPQTREQVAMCGTDAPDAKDFVRVPCAAEHSWRAISVVPFAEGDYPGAKAVSERGATPCEDAAGARADDPLDFEWGYEWPTAQQWKMGQTYGRCWAPD